MRGRLIAAACLAAAASASAAAPLPPLAPTPPMGWSTWYGLRCDFDEATLREMADRMVALGLRDAGYRYLNVDDCWAVRRDAAGELREDPKRFPSGMKPVGDYLHARGLRFGIYASAGRTTCQRELSPTGDRLPVGSKGHEFQDARTFAAMGADFVKYDWCGRYDTQDGASSYQIMRDAIAASGRPMLLSICEWGFTKPWTWAKGVGHMYRIAMDTHNCWACTTDWGAIGVVHTFDRLAEHAAKGGPDNWVDPDNLMIGNGVLTLDEERAQMSVYAVAAAPLLIAGDLRTMGGASLAILLNRDAIAINQDPLGKPGHRIRAEDGEEVWVRELSAGRRAVVLFNRSSQARTIALKWSELDLEPGIRLGAGREVWTGERLRQGDGVARRIAPHGAAMLLLEPASDGKSRRTVPQ